MNVLFILYSNFLSKKTKKICSSIFLLSYLLDVSIDPRNVGWHSRVSSRSLNIATNNNERSDSSYSLNVIDQTVEWTTGITLHCRNFIIYIMCNIIYAKRTLQDPLLPSSSLTQMCKSYLAALIPWATQSSWDKTLVLACWRIVGKGPPP